MLKIGIIGDHNLFRTGLRLFVESIGSFRVVHDAENHDKFFAGLGEGEVEVDLLLFHIKITDAANVMAYMSYRAKFPWIKVLIISQLEDRYGWERALELGADGIIMKDSDTDLLLTAIQAVKTRGFYIQDELKKLVGQAESKGRRLLGTGRHSSYFNEREMEIIDMACKEYNSIEIADKLCINVRTVENHRKRIMEKTDSKNFIGAIVFALKNNHIEMDDL